MTIIDDSALADIRLIGRCEVCGRRGPVDPHHILKRGLGGGGRIDHPYNLLAICRLDHAKLEVAQLDWRGRKMTAMDCFGLVALREGLLHRDLEDAVRWFANCSPKLNETEIERRVIRLRPGTGKLVSVLLEAREKSLEAA